MLTTLCLGTLLLAADPVPPSTSSIPKTEKVLKVLAEWVRTYRKGKWKLGQPPLTRPMALALQKKLLIVKHKLVPADASGETLSYVDEVRLLCGLAAKVDDADAARVLLMVAAIGLDTKTKYTPEMLPNVVRHYGQQNLAALQSDDAIQYLANAAAGDINVKGFKTSMQAAAVRSLGVYKKAGHLKVVLGQLESGKPVVRVAAAEAIPAFEAPGAVEQLAERLENEADPAVVMAILTATDRIKSGTVGKTVKDEHIRWVTIQAGLAIGRTESWAADLAIVNFLEKFRYRDSVDALVKVLERFGSDNKVLKSGKVSGRLRFRAHEVLISLTGTHIAIDQPDKWREFWEREKNNLKIIAEKPQDKPKQGATGSPSKFFNIPVRGTRVVFVIDRSGSMNWPKNGRPRRGGTVGGGRGGGGAIKITVAKRELLKAVMALPRETKFNVIFYNDRVSSWKNKLVHATKGNKAALEKWLSKLRAMGATNIFDAMQEALKMKSLVYGSRYDSNVDEVFLLSDGEPTAGRVMDSVQIVKLVTETNKFSGVRINTVFIGGNAGGGGGGGPGGGPGRGGPGGGRGGFAQSITGAELMRRLAKQNGGKFVQP